MKQEKYDEFRLRLNEWLKNQSRDRISLRSFESGKKYAIVDLISTVGIHTYWKMFIDEQLRIYRLVNYTGQLSAPYDKRQCIKMHGNELCVSMQTDALQSKEYHLEPPQTLVETRKTTIREIVLRFDRDGNLCFHSFDLVTNHNTNQFQIEINCDGCFFKNLSADDEKLAKDFFL